MKTWRVWECLGFDTVEDLAENVREYHIRDFSNSKNHGAFGKALVSFKQVYA